MNDARKDYADIIDREHHVSKHRQPMPRIARAAQFSPFAALTGYDDLVAESARLTDARIQLTEEEKVAVNDVLTWMTANPASEAAFTYFVPDKMKSGGSYETVTGRIKKHDALRHTILLESGEVIPIEDICEVSCPEYERQL
ncbi:MAG: hypothetical protein J5649_09120 [Lachnospiraceae bacterium]|nr:hypothetical protein [Lachnospiraceae bacterium]